MSNNILERTGERILNGVDRLLSYPPRSVGSVTVTTVIDERPRPHVSIVTDHREQRGTSLREPLYFHGVPRDHFQKGSRAEVIFVEARLAPFFSDLLKTPRMGNIYARPLSEDTYGKFPNGHDDTNGLGNNFVMESTDPEFFGKFVGNNP